MSGSEHVASISPEEVKLKFQEDHGPVGEESKFSRLNKGSFASVQNFKPGEGDQNDGIEDVMGTDLTERAATKRSNNNPDEEDKRKSVVTFQ